MTKEKEKEKRMTFSGLYVVLILINITCLIVSNIIVVKTVQVFGLIFAASNMIYPVTYILDDVFTEVYGYKKARFVTWMSFLCNLIVVIFFAITIALPASNEFKYQTDLVNILGNTPRVLCACFLSFLAGSLSNAIVLSKLKVVTKGKFLFVRTIGSTLVGEALDCIIFFPFAMYGTISNEALMHVMIDAFFFKVGLEILFTPITYFVISKVKKYEELDTFDHDEEYHLI